MLKTTNSFRSEQDVEDLWDGMCERVVRIVDEGLGGCEDPEAFLGTKFKVLTFVQTLEVRPPVPGSESAGAHARGNRATGTRSTSSTTSF